MVKQKQLYVYAMEFGRFDQVNRRFMIDPCLIVDFLAMPEDIQDTFTEEAEGVLDDRIVDVLAPMHYGELEARDKKKLLRGEPFYMMTEEYGFGFGYTKAAAQLAFVQGERENGAFDDDNCDW
jgi:hypothetical protein